MKMTMVSSTRCCILFYCLLIGTFDPYSSFIVNALAFQPSPASLPAAGVSTSATDTTTTTTAKTRTTTSGVPTPLSLYSNASSSRRAFLTSLVAVTTTTTTVACLSVDVANARYILNEETGDYEEVQDKEWQTEWKERLDKAQTMSTDDVFLAARGAKNRVDGMEESDARKNDEPWPVVGTVDC
jgi:hypothetical protein